MKKIISILLTVLMLCSVFSFGAFAAESKTETLLSDISEKKALSIEAGDITLVEGLTISGIKASAKLTENSDGTYDIQAYLTGRLFIFRVKLFIEDGELHAYIPLLFIHVNVTELLGEEVDFVGELATEVGAALEMFNEEFSGYFKLLSTGNKTVEGFGDVYVEEFGTDLKAAVKASVEKGELTLPEGTDINSMTDEEIYAMLGAYGEVGESLKNLSTSKAAFYYDGDTLVGFEVSSVDAEGNVQSTSSKEMLPFDIESISTEVNDSDFRQPFMCFDYTSTIVRIISAIEMM